MRNEDRASGVSIRIDEPATVPVLDLLFAYGAMVPLVAGAAAAATVPDGLAALCRDLALYWGAAILVFFAGVRRGTSFRTMGGPTFSQIAMMFALFGGGLAAVLALAYGRPRIAASIELAGYVGLAFLDPLAAKSGEVPLYFRRLRPPQMTLAAAAVLGLLLEAAGYL